MTHRVQKVVIHGHERAFVKIGTGPVLLLLHGLGCDQTEPGETDHLEHRPVRTSATADTRAASG